MFIRKRLNKTGTTTVYLIDSVRVDGKKHAVYKAVKCFGSTTNPQQIDQLVVQAEKLKQQLAVQHISSRDFITIKQPEDVTSCTVREIGIKHLYNTVFHALFAKLNLKGINKQTLADLVTMRIAVPVSKLKTANISETFGIEDLTANKIYKLMDNLTSSNIASIKKHVFQNTQNLFNDKIQVLFYDLTTIYFEANSQSDLKEFGFSKDGKSQHVQISLALIVTTQGMPIGYEIFKGNTFEGSTLIPTLSKLREEYKLNDITIVADSAMLSKENMDALIAHNYKFIISAKIKNMTSKLTKGMFDNDGYQVVEKGDNEFKYKSIALEDNRKLITVYSAIRRRKDEYDRNRALTKIKTLTGKSGKNGLKGALKKSYVKLDKDSIIVLDEKKLEQIKKYDGYFGFITNSDIGAAEVITQYRGLWQVEQSFRIAKHNLKIRPVYHYVDRRIKAHFAICYLSLALVRSVEYKLKQAGVYVPMEELHGYLNELKEVTITTSEVQSSITTDIHDKALEVFIALKIKLPSKYKVNCRV